MAGCTNTTSVGGQQDIVIPFYADEQPGLWRELGTYIVYERHVQEVLGEVVAEEENGKDVRRCFNCGCPGHTVSSCPDPIDRPLVALSRQIFEFFKGDNGIEFSRIHELGEWKRQRLEWLEGFEPGMIQGPLLREALGLEENDTGKYVGWLANIALWGYPRGWVGSEDPRLRVWETIQERTGSGSDAADEQPSSLLIHGERTDPEEVVLSFFSVQGSGPVSDAQSDSTCATPRRWAQYPDTYFSSSLLPVYNGLTLPPIGDITSNTAAMLSLERKQPWNGSGMVNGPSDTAYTPPPPTASPPPLPPTQPLSLDSRKPLVSLPLLLDDGGEQDMDLSDSE